MCRDVILGEMKLIKFVCERGEIIATVCGCERRWRGKKKGCGVCGEFESRLIRLVLIISWKNIKF
jgi:hypothetical protein